LNPRSSKILLISYVFPPYWGIGGRRWSKHAEELARLGYTVHVISARNPFRKKSLWTNNVLDSANIHLHQLPAKYPAVLVDYDHKAWEKLLYNLWIKVLPLFTRGSIFDRTIFWKKIMLRKAEELIRKHGIEKVICTGGPFSTMYHATFLKEKFKNIFLLNDMRDPWTWGPNWGYSSLSDKRLTYEKALEKKMVEGSDIVSVPSEDMKEFLSTRYPSQKHKFVTIPHFVDPSEVPVISKSPSGRKRFVLYGTIYEGMNDVIEKIALVFSKYKQAASLEIFTQQQSYSKLFEKAGATNVKFFQPLKPFDLFKRFENYDFVLLISPSYNKNNISTKFYEIIHSRTPVFLISGEGAGSRFITENHLGLHADLATLESKLDKLLRNEISFHYNPHFDTSPFTLSSVVKKIISLLNGQTTTAAF
jgi:glycosyltransferase involved in cell wall biosynthesis